MEIIKEVEAITSITAQMFLTGLYKSRPLHPNPVHYILEVFNPGVYNIHFRGGAKPLKMHF